MPTIIGFDSETNAGPPITMQFYSEHLPAINACIFVNATNVLDKTLRHLSKHCTSGTFVMYGHNLKFDVLSMFYPVYAELAMNKGAFDMTHRDWVISGIYGTPTFCVLKNSRGVTIYIVDGYSWFRTGLSNAAKLICPQLEKLPYPEGFGETQYTSKDDDFVAYAMRDAEVSYHVGLAVDRMHDEFELSQSLSVADMAARIFTQHYISEAAPIWNVGPRIIEGAVSSYHGGKNNTLSQAAPAWHDHVDAWDLSSAYPHAMTQMPAFSDPRLFAAARVFSNKSQSFPEHGIYCITGTVPDCEWPVIFDHDFKPIRGDFESIWVPGYELNEARRAGEIKLSRVFGHIYDTDRDPVTNTGLQRYVKDFYEKKQNATDPVRRYLYKTLLNSLYGKFIQSREIEPDGDSGVRWKHGPLYHPFMASLITGHTRSVMHRLEHQVKALHTATDGVYCGMRNSPPNGLFDWAPQSGIGSIESEGHDMELGLLRNKLYVMYTKNPAEGFKSFVRPDRYVQKYAKHGFQGDVPALERAVVAGERTYTVNKPNTLITSVKRGLVPNKFEVRKMKLNVSPIMGYYDWS